MLTSLRVALYNFSVSSLRVALYKFGVYSYGVALYSVYSLHVTLYKFGVYSLRVALYKSSATMVFSCYLKQRVLYPGLQGYKPPTISVMLQKEGTVANRRGILKFLKRYKETI